MISCFNSAQNLLYIKAYTIQSICFRNINFIKIPNHFVPCGVVKLDVLTLYISVLFKFAKL